MTLFAACRLLEHFDAQSVHLQQCETRQRESAAETRELRERLEVAEAVRGDLVQTQMDRDSTHDALRQVTGFACAC